MKYVKKITMRTVGLDTDTLEQTAIANPKKEISVLRVYGRVSGVVSAQSSFSDNGEPKFYQKFTGEFEAINLLATEISEAKVRSQALILPPDAEYVIQSQLGAARKADPKSSIEFGLEITVLHHTPPKGGKGYQFKYGVKVLGDNNPVEDSLTLIGAKFGAVPAVSGKKK